MASTELMAGYTYIGDIFSLVLAICIMIMIHQSLFFSTETSFKMYRLALASVMATTFSNMMLATVCNYYPDNIMLIYLLRYLDHTFIWITIMIFITYLRDQLDLVDRQWKVVTYSSYAINITLLLLDYLAPLTHFGIYYDGQEWHKDKYIQPFAFVYICAAIILSIMIFTWGNKLVKQVRNTLVMVNSMGIALIIAENITDNSNITSFTLILPMIAVLVMIHSMPYDSLSGAMHEKALESYVAYCNIHKSHMAYIILELKNEVQRDVPSEIARTVRTEWDSRFKGVKLFNMTPYIFLLSIPLDQNKDIEKTVKEAVQSNFDAYYERYQIPYKLLVIQDGSFIERIEDITITHSIIGKQIPYGQVYFLKEREMEDLIRGRYVINQLKDIHDKCDLNDERVKVFCQPIKNVQSGEYNTAEALMRLDLPECGIVPPVVFIEMAEKSGWIHSLSKIILNKTCLAIREYLDEGYNIECVSINFSALEIRDENFCKDIIDIIKSNKVPFEKIAIELTESQNDSDYEMFKEKISQLKEYGIKFYLDDFGTGYSNFDRVMKLGMDIVKFDRALLLYADEDETSVFTMKHFSESLKAMNYKLLFEGVETENQEDICRQCKADYLQGFKYSKPIPIEEAKTFFSK